MNTILVDQNTDENIRLLKAQRVAYAVAKKIQFRFEAFALSIAMSIPLFYIFFPDYKTIAGISGTILSLIAIFIDRHQRSITKKGASIQEIFDRRLFKLPENPFSGAEKVSSEEIIMFANRYEKDDVKNWYSESITEDLPHNIAVVICQKSNLYWDIKLRKRFINFIYIVAAIYFVLFILALSKSFSYTSDFLLNIILLLIGSSAFIKYCYVTITEKNDMIKEKAELNLKLDTILNTYNSTKLEPELAELSDVQTVIFNSRKKGIKVPDWFYYRYLKSQEEEMNSIAKTLADETRNSK